MAACCAIAPAHARSESAWLKTREAQFAAWQAAHATIDAQSADSTITAEIWDRVDAPRMTVIPAGDYMMGSPVSEATRNDDEDPSHPVRIRYSLAVSTYPIIVGEFAHFATAARYKTNKDCEAYEHEAGRLQVRSWREPGFTQNDSHPVTCVSWNDAKAYVTWLSKQSGHRYRLLSEAEYEYAARSGTTGAYWWGDENGIGRANCDGCGSAWDNMSTAPVGSFQPNAFGLYDMLGNAWSWTGDCWNANYIAAPSDGSAATSGDCDLHVLRGGSWYFNPRSMRSASRYWIGSHYRFYDVGFRVARTL